MLAPVAVFAQINEAVGNLNKVAKPTGLSADFEGSMSTVITTALSLVGSIFLGLMIYAGILWMTAAGEEDKVTKAKNILKAAIIGLAVTMSAYAITAFVTGKLSST
jgi:hypothetical protein